MRSCSPHDMPRGPLSGPEFRDGSRSREAGGISPLHQLMLHFAISTRLPALNSNTLRVYSSTDLIGVELGGALKNVIAIAAGVSDGLGLGNNARAALITRGLSEISAPGRCTGRSSPETFMGLTGVGDLAPDSDRRLVTQSKGGATTRRRAITSRKFWPTLDMSRKASTPHGRPWRLAREHEVRHAHH